MMKNTSAKKLLMIISWMTALSIIILAGITTLTTHHSALEVQQWLKIMSLPLTLIRCTLYFIIFLNWPFFIKQLAKHYQWDEPHLSYALAQRYKVLIWLMLFELIFAQNSVGQLIQLFF